MALHKVLILISVTFALMTGCVTETKQPSAENKTEAYIPSVPLPVVNADSAMAFLKQQVDFGPRIPGTKAHAQCAEWMKTKMLSYGMEVTEQNGMTTTYDGKTFNLRNIISVYRPDLKRRLLLCAHWDTRPFADRDEKDKDKPFDGANDGASGVAVLMETARLISESQPEIGIDFIFFDLEDYGDAEGKTHDSWCLGSQFWSKNLHVPGYSPVYGILLDMVGGRDAIFPKEGTSMKYAPGIVNKVWSLARSLGYTMFVNNVGPETTDDHLYINKIAGIPCINIVHYEVTRMDYMSCHHRHCDNLSNIDPNMMKMVGQLLIEIIHREAALKF